MFQFVLDWLHFQDKKNREHNTKPSKQLRFAMKEKLPSKTPDQFKIHPIVMKHFQKPREETNISENDKEYIDYYENQKKIGFEDYEINMRPVLEGEYKLHVERDKKDNPT